MRVVFALAACLILTRSSLAVTTICAEDISTGFNWEDGAWHQANYPERNWIAKEISVDDKLAVVCKAEIERDGLSIEPVMGEGFSTSYGCFTFSVVGEEPGFGDVQRCLKYMDVAGVLSSAECKHDIWMDVMFDLDGEFVLNRTAALIMSEPDAAGERDSVVLAIGKCTSVEP